MSLENREERAVPAPPRVGRIEAKVLAALASVAGDFGVLSFRSIARRAKIKRTEIRRACRSLKRKGLAEFHRGCWTEDGEPAGSGYSATRAGEAAADTKAVERIINRFWD